MILCGKCKKPIHLRSTTLRFPKNVTRICDDCSLLLDHLNEPEAILPLEPVIT